MKRELKEYPELPSWAEVSDNNIDWKKRIVISNVGGEEGINYVDKSYEGEFFDGESFDKRSVSFIRPIPKPEYIPYTYEDSPEFRDCWVALKGKKDQMRIRRFNETGVFTNSVNSGDLYSVMLRDYEIVNQDGTTRPFGKLKEDWNADRT